HDLSGHDPGNASALSAAWNEPTDTLDMCSVGSGSDEYAPLGWTDSSSSSHDQGGSERIVGTVDSRPNRRNDCCLGGGLVRRPPRSEATGSAARREFAGGEHC